MSSGLFFGSKIFEITPTDARFADLFAAVPLEDKPPKHLWVAAQNEEALTLLDRTLKQGVAIVGTREPKERSLYWMRQMMRGIPKDEAIIVSGFARGIDGAAHRAAIEYGIPTIAVLGCGIDTEYPQEHVHLRTQIIQAGGLLVTEIAPATKIYASQFLNRNRLIAAWSRATLVVEAAARSGSLSTANWASRFGRELYAVPAFPGDPAYAGNELLLDAPNKVATVCVSAKSLKFYPVQRKHSAPPLPEELKDLWQKIYSASQGEGIGIGLETLYNRAIASGGTSDTFLSQIRALTELGLIHEYNGRVRANGG